MSDSQTLAIKKEPVTNDEHEPLLEAKLPEHSSEGKPPTHTTFYGYWEMTIFSFLNIFHKTILDKGDCKMTL